MTTLRLILGDQLHIGHSWFSRVDEDVLYVMMEVRSETDYVLHHAQKIIAIFSAMRDFARQLRMLGHRVHYLEIDAAENSGSFTKNLTRLALASGATRFEWQAPDEWRLDVELSTLPVRLRLPSRRFSTEHFFTARDDFSRLFKGRQSWLMEHFYRSMRQRHDILMSDAGSPVGGRWNFDAENRKSWLGSPPVPSDWRSTHDHTRLWQTIQAAGIRSFGHPKAEDFRWPVNRDEALADLEAFIQHALPHFGDYQDALSTRSWRLFHSLLSFAMNVKLLTAREVVTAAVQAYHSGNVPLPAAEGFIRQILGWREYVRGVYWATMPAYSDVNYFGHSRHLPAWFWTGDTRMRCMASSISQSLEQAYAHHIQRLMVIGNFALLAGLSPQAVHQWYLGIYIDAFEWVEMPNTLGMSQYADGGRLATKPYVSSAAYIDRMGDYCRSCHYDRKARIGDRACPFNALYWDFLARHADKLAHNPRLAMPYRTLARMEDKVLAELRARAQSLTDNLDRL